MQGQRLELTLGSCGRDLPRLHGAQDGEADLCRSLTQPLPSGWPFASFSI